MSDPESSCSRLSAIPVLTVLVDGNPAYPSGAREWERWCSGDSLFDGMAAYAPPAVSLMGNAGLLARPGIGIVCSSRCPGSIVLDTYTLVRRMQPDGPTFIGGFHSPMERTCLDVLLARRVPVAYCPGRRLHPRALPALWKPALAEQRLALLSPFRSSQRRVTTSLARDRNAFVAVLSDILLVPYARDRGKVAGLVATAVARGKKVVTVRDAETDRLVMMGATQLGIEELAELCVEMTRGQSGQ